jgi:hypothetical protein
MNFGILPPVSPREDLDPVKPTSQESPEEEAEE